jgi:hypothetical protein
MAFIRSYTVMKTGGLGMSPCGMPQLSIIAALLPKTMTRNKPSYIQQNKVRSSSWKTFASKNVL